jgi:hypothetical protein
MRIASILAAGTLACGLALAAGRSENITYVDGNLTGVTRQSSGNLAYSGPEAMELKAGLSTLAVPYSGIGKAGLSAPQQHSSDVPLYKVWALHKHFSKTETQLLTVEFKDDQGEARTMTLELGTSAASAVLNAIKQHNPSVETATLAQAGPAVPALASRLTSEPAHKSSKADAKSKASEPEETKAAATPATASDKDAWWGDRYWKTGRNVEKWGQSSANAPE